MKQLSQSEFIFKRDLSILYDDLLYCKCENGEVTIAKYINSKEENTMSEYPEGAPETKGLTFTCGAIKDESILEKNNYKIKYISINVVTERAVNLSLPHVELEAPHEVWIPKSVLRNHDPDEQTVYVWSVFADDNLEGFTQ